MESQFSQKERQHGSLGTKQIWAQMTGFWRRLWRLQKEEDVLTRVWNHHGLHMETFWRKVLSVFFYPRPTCWISLLPELFSSPEFCTTCPKLSKCLNNSEETRNSSLPGDAVGCIPVFRLKLKFLISRGCPRFLFQVAFPRWISKCERSGSRAMETTRPPFLRIY